LTYRRKLQTSLPASLGSVLNTSFNAALVIVMLKTGTSVHFGRW